MANMKMQFHQRLSISVTNQPGHFSTIQTKTITLNTSFYIVLATQLQQLIGIHYMVTNLVFLIFPMTVRVRKPSSSRKMFLPRLSGR